MEKFAVDLDKVLDEFEYNEEQAIRSSQYIREDLPAKRYQRPPFQRINLADADFSASLQTASPHIPYVASHSSASQIKEGNAEQLSIVGDSQIPDLLDSEFIAEESSASLKLPDLTETGDAYTHDSLYSNGNYMEPEESPSHYVQVEKPLLVEACGIVEQPAEAFTYNTPCVDPYSYREANGQKTEQGDSFIYKEKACAVAEQLSDPFHTSKAGAIAEQLADSFSYKEVHTPNAEQIADTFTNKEVLTPSDNIENERLEFLLHATEDISNQEVLIDPDELSPLDAEDFSCARLQLSETLDFKPDGNLPVGNLEMAKDEEGDLPVVENNELPDREPLEFAMQPDSTRISEERTAIRQNSVNEEELNKFIESMPETSVALEQLVENTTHTVEEPAAREERLKILQETATREERSRVLEEPKREERTIALERTKTLELAPREGQINEERTVSLEKPRQERTKTLEPVPREERSRVLEERTISLEKPRGVDRTKTLELATEERSRVLEEPRKKEITSEPSLREEKTLVLENTATRENRILVEEQEKTLEKPSTKEERTKTVEPAAREEAMEETVNEEKPIEEEMVKFVKEEISAEELDRSLNELDGEGMEKTAEEVSGVEEVSISEEEGQSSGRARPSSLDLKSSSTSPQPEVEAEAGSAAPSEIEGQSSDREESPPSDEGAVQASSPAENEENPLTDPDSPPPLTEDERRLGKVQPFWVPDEDALNCMQCGIKFNIVKRRHHCRACGQVLCGKCCGMRAALEYLRNQEHRVCEVCFRIITKVMMYEETESDGEVSPRRQPNPNNPMEYCSTVPPPLQASPSGSQTPPSVLVPVLKREGSTKNKEKRKKVMFMDGIRPGGDLAEQDEPPAPRVSRSHNSPKRIGTPPGSVVPSPIRILPPIDPATQSFIVDNKLPPVCEVHKGSVVYQNPWPHEKLLERLADTDQHSLLFAVNRYLIVSLKIVKLDCCMGRTCWLFTTRGMSAVGQDEILILLQVSETPNEPVPVQVFVQLHAIYQSADKGNAVGELGYWMVRQSNFLDSREHGGFLFVRPTFQCLQNLDKPSPPYLVAILIHRMEIPWARLFPLRLLLRLGAEFRYYPCSLVSIRHREPVYYEIGQTIMNLLADFRSYTFSIPSVSGLRIHMEAQQTSVLIPRNRYDQVVRALNNSNDPVLALAGTFSPDADSHLVCMQSKGDEVSYSTQAINIHDKPRKVTGASFVVFNASLKAAAGVEGKLHIVEDGVMVEISADTMTKLRTRLRAMDGWSIKCAAKQDETIQVVWTEDEKDFNRGVRSVIDDLPLDGVPSIRVHNGNNYMSGTRFIRWTQVFIIKCEDGGTSAKIGDPPEVNRLSEAIARATCTALAKAQLLESLAQEGNNIIALRTTITQDSVCYEAGSNGVKLAPAYMHSLDNELIPVLHKATVSNIDSRVRLFVILELLFHILDQ